MLAKTAGTARYCYNWGLAKWNEMYKNGEACNTCELSRLWTQERPEWAKETYRGSQTKAFMFLGASGQGKSTHSDMWVRYIDGSTLINDDNPVLRIADDGTPIIYGSPWSGKRPIYKQVHYPIGGMAAIEQERENRIHKENIPTAFGIMLCSCSTLKFDKKVHMNICSTISNVLERIPIHTLSCRPDEEAAKVSSNAFGI